MIGVFDSGYGGLTVFEALVQRFPQYSFTYLGDHARAPYGNRSSADVLALTQQAVDTLFQQGCQIVILGCNTATAVAARPLQQNWLPASCWADTGHNVLGIVAPTVEMATQTPWCVTAPTYPQKYNQDTLAIFATRQTIETGVYVEEILKRCPHMQVVQQACPQLAGAIEAQEPTAGLQRMITDYVRQMLDQCTHIPHGAILGCTHYPLVADLFQAVLPPQVRLYSQPPIVADSLEDYLSRHPTLLPTTAEPRVRILTTGVPADVSRRLQTFWPHLPAVEACVVSGGPAYDGRMIEIMAKSA